MCIFNKENGMIRNDNIPFNKPKKFFDMSKITKINPVLKRNGDKNSYMLIINVLNIRLTAMTCTPLFCMN